MPASTRLNLAVGLPLRNAEALDRLLERIADPESADYRHYLTPEQFTEQFGPSEADYQSLIAFAESRGLKVTGTHANRMLLDLSGAVADIEKAFHVNMLFYQHPARGLFYAADREPSFDFSIHALDIAGLDNYEVPRPMSLSARAVGAVNPMVTGSGPSGLFIGNDFRAAYAPGVALTGSTDKQWACWNSTVFTPAI